MIHNGSRIGHIRITGVLGTGGMGHVYSAVDETLERRVAVKVIHALERLGAEARSTLIREARALSARPSQHLPRLRLCRRRRGGLHGPRVHRRKDAPSRSH